MMKKNVLLLCGGGSTEHEISMVSAGYIEQNIKDLDLYNVIKVEIGFAKSKDKAMRLFGGTESGKVVEINSQGFLQGADYSRKISFVVPCIHGPPGENGEIQSLLDLYNLPYLGCKSEASQICFNKINTTWIYSNNI